MACSFRCATMGITKFRALTGKWMEWTTASTAKALGSRGLRFQPTLKHQKPPHLPGAIVVSIQHAFPNLPHCFCSEQPRLPKSGSVERTLDPFAKPAAHPSGNGYAEASLWTIHEFAWHVTME